MKTKLLFFTILFLFLSSITLGETPFQTSEGLSNELTIINPKNEFFFPNGQNLTLHFQVTNSTGKILNISEFDCNIHVYDSNNINLYEVALIDGAGNYDKAIRINNTVTGSVGEYPYNIFCNSSEGEHGFLSNAFYVSKRGFRTDNLNLILLGVLSLIFLGVGLTMLIISNMFKREEEVLQHLKKLFFYLGLFHLVIISFFISSVSNCTGFECYQINNYGGLGVAYFSSMVLVFLYVLYLYGYSRVEGTTKKLNNELHRK